MFGAHLEMFWVVAMFCGSFISIPLFIAMKKLAHTELAKKL
jgi:hypothetical protein